MVGVMLYWVGLDKIRSRETRVYYGNPGLRYAGKQFKSHRNAVRSSSRLFAYLTKRDDLC